MSWVAAQVARKARAWATPQIWLASEEAATKASRGVACLANLQHRQQHKDRTENADVSTQSAACATSAPTSPIRSTVSTSEASIGIGQAPVTASTAARPSTQSETGTFEKVPGEDSPAGHAVCIRDSSPHQSSEQIVPATQGYQDVHVKSWLPDFQTAAESYPDSSEAINMLRSLPALPSVYVRKNAGHISTSILEVLRKTVPGYAPFRVPEDAEATNLRNQHSNSSDSELRETSSSTTSSDTTTPKLHRVMGHGNISFPLPDVVGAYHPSSDGKQPTVSQGGEHSHTEGNKPRRGKSTTNGCMQEVPMLMSNLGKCLQKHPKLKKVLGLEGRKYIRHMLQAASGQTHRYSDPAFAAQMASAQSRMHFHCRTFWKNLHPDHLATWNAASAATVIHSFGALHEKHSKSEFYKDASEGRMEHKLMHAARDSNLHNTDDTNQTSSSKDDFVKTTGAAGAPPALEQADKKITAGDSSAPSAPKSPADAIGHGSKPDLRLQEFQRMALRKFVDEMNFHGVQTCVSSFGRQCMLKGEVLQLVQRGIKRTAADVKDHRLSVLMRSLYFNDVALGEAEDAVKTIILNPEGIIADMHVLNALNAVKVMEHWGWECGEVREVVLKNIPVQAQKLYATEVAQILALFGELQVPLEAEHKPLLITLIAGCRKMPIHRISAARSGLNWAQSLDGNNGINKKLLQDAIEAVVVAKSDWTLKGPEHLA